MQEKNIAKKLLQIKAIKLQPTNPFTWASGWKSPIYCDNRKTLSFPGIRNLITSGLTETVRNNFPDIDMIAGVATGAIAQGALVADRLDLPFVYIRSSAKSHGMGNRVEGDISQGKTAVVIEDLVSTGGSSLNAVEALRNAGIEVKGMIAIFSYNFHTADKNFEQHNCRLFTLTNYTELLETAVEMNYIKEGDIKVLQNWRKAPANWDI